MMGLPSPVSTRSYSEHNDKFHEILKEMSLKSFSSASTHIHRLQGQTRLCYRCGCDVLSTWFKVWLHSLLWCYSGDLLGEWITASKVS